uniref:Protein-serine/threonine phosphatase n=1 Tax=Aegilops tauschii subsp. strangulata TaxID=200361 RepID=A0A453LM65_AEGTS
NLQEDSLSAVCEKVLDRCLAPESGGEGCDNMTMILVVLKKPTDSAATSSSEQSPVTPTKSAATASSEQSAVTDEEMRPSEPDAPKTPSSSK